MIPSKRSNININLSSPSSSLSSWRKIAGYGGTLAEISSGTRTRFPIPHITRVFLILVSDLRDRVCPIFSGAGKVFLAH